MSVVAAPAAVAPAPDAAVVAAAAAAPAPVVATVAPVEVKPVVEAKPVTPEVKPEPGLLSLEDQPADDKKIEAKKDEAKPDADLKIALPEGVTLPDETIGEYRTALKDAGVTDPDVAAKLVAADLKRQDEATKAGEKLVSEQNAKWMQEIKADPEFGGQHFDANLLASKGFLRRSPEGVALANAIQADGLGSYPPLFKFIASLAKANKEDSSGVGSGGGKPPSELSSEEKLRIQYPSMYLPDGSRKP